MRIGPTEIDFEAHQINGPAGNFTIEPMVMKVLSVLMDNEGEVVTREKLIDEVWGVGYGGDERLSRAVSLLRKSLGDTRGNHNYIQTIPKTGYKFVLQGIEADQEQPIEVDETLMTTAQPDAGLIATKPKKREWNKLFPALTAGLLVLAAIINFNKTRLSSLAKGPPLVMVMDSAHPARVYDEEVKASGATNADILSDIFSDLPVKTQKELISPSWDRYEAITQFDPDLIVIHYSGFKQEDSSGDRPQLRLLIDYFQKTDTEFLVYSRASQEWLDGNMNIVLEELYAENPDLKSRINIFPLLEYGEPEWKDPASAQGIKLKVKEMLELE